MSMTSRSNFTIRLEQFEGPLDLLLYLIQSQELDISTVSISKITNQYLITLKLMQDMNFDVASEFLLMAATLILWKSKAILPRDEELVAAEEDSNLPLTQEELVRQLLNRQRYLENAGYLAERPLLGEDVFVKATKRPPVEKIWKEMNVSQIASTYQDLLIRESRRARVVMKKETVSLSEKIQEFGRRLTMNKITPMQEMVADPELRGEWVVAFLASLELSRLKKVRIYQEKVFDPIYVELVDTLASLDLKMATGFDYTPVNGISPGTKMDRPAILNQIETSVAADTIAKNETALADIHAAETAAQEATILENQTLADSSETGAPHHE